MSQPLLNMLGIGKRFGASLALQNVSLEIDAGLVHALIGENGAGKSTLMKILSGAHQPDTGTMTLTGKTYAPRSPQDARIAGIGMIYQELNLAPHMSIEDNIMLGQEASRFGYLKRRQQRKRIRDVLEQLGHPNLPLEWPVYRLSTGMQQLIEIARALIAESKIIVFDEPTSSLTQHDVERLFQVIKSLKASGLGIIYISHFLEEIREVCDRYVVLRDGQSVGTGDLKEATEDQIVSLMVGRLVQELFPIVPHKPSEVLVSIKNLSGQHYPQHVDLEIRRGEILGIAGLVGAGRTELLRCLYALDKVQQGEIKIATNATAATPQSRIAAGMGFVSEDRKGEGLAQTRSIIDNTTYSHLKPYSRLGWLNLTKRKRAVKKWLERLQIKARSYEQAVAELSGGNQQKVAVARILHQQAEIILLDEPTRGIDVGTKAEIYRLMGEQAAQGKAIVFVSSYFTELLAICDRIAVMSRGQIRDIRPVQDWNEETLMSQAIIASAD